MEERTPYVIVHPDGSQTIETHISIVPDPMPNNEERMVVALESIANSLFKLSSVVSHSRFHQQNAVRVVNNPNV